MLSTLAFSAAPAVVAATTFGVMLPVELPDKTLLATLLLSTRYRPLPVFVGVCGAFAVQVVIAVSFGSVLALLPQQLVAAAVAVLFALGAVLLLRESRAEQTAAEPETGLAEHTPAWRIALTAFGVLFLAEWGDASQLAIAALTARFDAPLAVGAGAFAALAAVAALAVLLGRKLQGRIRPRLMHRIGAGVFCVLALLATAEAAGLL